MRKTYVARHCPNLKIKMTKQIKFSANKKSKRTCSFMASKASSAASKVRVSKLARYASDGKKAFFCKCGLTSPAKPATLTI